MIVFLIISFLVSSSLLAYEAGSGGRLPPAQSTVAVVANEVLSALRMRRREMERYCDGLVLSRRSPLTVIDEEVAEEEDGSPTPQWMVRAYDLMLERLLDRLYHGHLVE